MRPELPDLALSLLACRRGHVGDWLSSASSGWRVCRSCRRDDRRRLRVAYASMKDRSAAKFGKPRPATTPHQKHLAAKRQRVYRATLASGPQAHDPSSL